ncbi:MAG: murein hydrolase activator EnvC family protein [Chthoniobacterales bacterium]
MRIFLFWAMLGVAAAAHAADSGQKQQVARTRIADGFDFPVGKPNADGYYKARGFRPNGHLGEDWNGLGGGNTDLGSPIFSTAHGLVVFARDVHLGWGNVVVIRHVFYENGHLVTIDSLYGHLDAIKVREGQQVLRGQLIGTMGTAHGIYPAHLHFEIHKNIAMGVTRNGFKHDYTNYYSPTEFINTRRSLPGGGRTTLVAINTFTETRTFSAPTNGGAAMKKNTTNTDNADIVPPKPDSSGKRTPNFRVNRFGDLEDNF